MMLSLGYSSEPTRVEAFTIQPLWNLHTCESWGMELQYRLEKLTQTTSGEVQTIFHSRGKDIFSRIQKTFTTPLSITVQHN